MVYNQTLSTETFQVLYIDDHFTPIYIYILSVRTLNFVIDNAELEIFSLESNFLQHHFMKCKHRLYFLSGIFPLFLSYGPLYLD